MSSAVTDRPIGLPQSTESTEVNTASKATESSEGVNVGAGPSSEPAVEIMATPSTNSTAQQFHTPEDIRGFPKAEARKTENKSRAKGKSMIATDTPVKEALKLKKSMKKPTKSNTQLRSAGVPRKRLYADSDSESSDSDGICEDTSDNSDTGICLLDDQKVVPNVGDYVLAKFSTVKKNNVYFIGEILTEKDDNGDYEVSYMQPSKKMIGKFVKPVQPKIEMTNEASISMVLPPPTYFGTTKRQKANFSFAVDFGSIVIN